MTRLPRTRSPRPPALHSIAPADAHAAAPATPATPVAVRLAARACAVAAALVLAGCYNESGEERQQTSVVENFYRIHANASGPGLPTTEELGQYQPLVSQALYTLLTQAEAAEARYHAVAGSTAPPIVGGDLFTSLYEGATSFSVQSCDGEDQRASCQVDFSYKKDKAEEAWSDKVWLVREGGQWRIDDIEFVGNDQSSHREYLTDTLTDAIREAG